MSTERPPIDLRPLADAAALALAAWLIVEGHATAAFWLVFAYLLLR